MNSHLRIEYYLQLLFVYSNIPCLQPCKRVCWESQEHLKHPEKNQSMTGTKKYDKTLKKVMTSASIALLHHLTTHENLTTGLLGIQMLGTSFALKMSMHSLSHSNARQHALT